MLINRPAGQDCVQLVHSVSTTPFWPKHVSVMNWPTGQVSVQSLHTASVAGPHGACWYCMMPHEVQGLQTVWVRVDALHGAAW